MDALADRIPALLVANRGEIAVRVLRTCRRLGIVGVAVYTDADALAPHVRVADHALRVDSYLDIDAVVDAAALAGATAIHPGYGFLSERAAFARAVEAAGLILVGPSADVMERMGRKDAAREIAVRAGVPVVPSFELGRESETMTFPVLVKAAAGGGGKGMRIVRSAAELGDGVAAARRESLAAFGDDALLIETYVERGRHVEVQVLADQHGTVLHLHERDCSVQRRHQKVIEEAPAPTIDDHTRSSLLEAAVGLARTVGYVSAGTVEFLLDSSSGAFYFLEMNTRLQVEHPVTEEICGGLDLVELQLRVAAGERLPIAQTDIDVRGHAIEARVYAEDPDSSFLPQAGLVRHVRWPSGPGIRVDQALVDGQQVTTAYDPMLGKIIASGPDRETARRRLVEALDDTAVLGLTTNVGFLRRLAAGSDFADAAIDVAWLDRNVLEPQPVDQVQRARALAAWLAAERARTAAGTGPFAADGWRVAGPPAPLLIALDDLVEVDPAAGRVVGAAGSWSVVDRGAEGDRRLFTIDGDAAAVTALVEDRGIELVLSGQRFRFAARDVVAEHSEGPGDGVVTAPMPSTVVEIRVAVGDSVGVDQPLAVVEAMKMEVTLRAPFAGTVTSVAGRPGARVRQGDHLITVEPS